MSDIVQNALRYNTYNTMRVDIAGKNTGQQTGLEHIGMPVIGFDCSGFFYHVVRESGYAIGRESASSYLISEKFTDINRDDVEQGDMINFGNHVGIVISYDANSKIGKFMHMSGQNNKGGLKRSTFTTDEAVKKEKDETIYYGIKRKIKAFRRIKEEYYNPVLDLHKDGRDPNPVLHPITGSTKANTNKQQVPRQGDKGPEVIKVQKALKKHVPSTPTHGTYDRMTVRAIKVVQIFFCMTPTGLICKELLKRLKVILD